MDERLVQWTADAFAQCDERAIPRYASVLCHELVRRYDVTLSPSRYDEIVGELATNVAVYLAHWCYDSLGLEQRDSFDRLALAKAPATELIAFHRDAISNFSRVLTDALWSYREYAIGWFAAMIHGRIANDDLLLMAFIDDLLSCRVDLALSGRELENVRQVLLSELASQIECRRVALLSETDLVELDRLLDANSSRERLAEFFARAIPQDRHEVADILGMFRRDVLDVRSANA